MSVREGPTVDREALDLYAGIAAGGAAEPQDPPELLPAHGVLRYATVEAAERYRQIMRLLYLEHRHFGLRLNVEDVRARLRDAYELELPAELVAAKLDQLHEWGAVDRAYDAGLARTAAELRRNRFTYDVTQAGKRVEQLLEELDRLSDAVGALDGQRLPAIHDGLGRLAELLSLEQPEPAEVRAALERLLDNVERLHEQASDFMAHLNRVIATSERVDEEEFDRCKGVLIDHLSGFRQQLRRHADPIEAELRRVDRLGARRMADLILSVADVPALPGFTREQVLERQRAELLEQWNGIRRWFEGSGQRESPWAALGEKVVDAVRAVLDIAERIIDKRTRRADRARACEHLARLVHDAPQADAVALVVAALGLGHPRHVSVPEDDPEAVRDPGRTPWALAPAAPVLTHLRRPGTRTPGAGRGTGIVEPEALRARMRERRAAKRAELERMLRRFRPGERVRLSALSALSQTEFGHLLHWIGRAYEVPPDADGTRHAESRDGRTRIRLRAPAPERPPIVLRVPQGRLRTADYELEVQP